MAAQWMTYEELAQQAGISRNAARVLVQRRQWRRESGNDGRVRVHVDTEAIRLDRAGAGAGHVRPKGDSVETGRAGADTGHEQGARAPARNGDLIPSHLLADQQERHEAEIKRIESRHTAEIERMIHQHEHEINRLQGAYRAASDALMEKVAMVLVANRRRPWWRLLG